MFGEFKRQLWVEEPTIEMNRPLAAWSIVRKVDLYENRSEGLHAAVSVIKTLAPRFLLWRILQRLAQRG